MKTKLFLALAVAVLLGACASRTKYTITGHAADFEDGRRAYLATVADDEIVILDSSIVENNSFTFKGKVEKPCWAKIGVLESLESGEGIMVEIILEPGNITLGDYDEKKSRERTATGTPLNDKLTQFFIEEKAIIDDTVLSRTESMFQVFLLVRSYVLANADNELGIFLFERFHPSMPNAMKLELIKVMAATNPALYSDLQKETLERLEEERRLEEQAKNVTPGNNYKEIRCKGVDGEEIALSDVIAKNRYVLLDFWASSCVPCMHELPHLLAAYEKYHSKGLEIYALSLDNDKNAWRNTIKEKDMSWVNVLRESTEVSEQYGVRGVPSNFLIDCSTGKIIAVHLGGETLIAKLMELFE